MTKVPLSEMTILDSENILHPLFSCQINKDVHLVILQQAERSAQVMALLHRAIVVDQSVL